jgi:hypothetical protein
LYKDAQSTKLKKSLEELGNSGNFCSAGRERKSTNKMAKEKVSDTKM